MSRKWNKKRLFTESWEWIKLDLCDIDFPSMERCIFMEFRKCQEINKESWTNHVRLAIFLWFSIQINFPSWFIILKLRLIFCSPTLNKKKMTFSSAIKIIKQFYKPRARCKQTPELIYQQISPRIPTFLFIFRRMSKIALEWNLEISCKSLTSLQETFKMCGRIFVSFWFFHTNFPCWNFLSVEKVLKM